MLVQKIIQESINKNPLVLKEALEEELRSRVALALEAKVAESNDNDDEDDCDDDDEDDDMDESFDLSDYTVEELEDFVMSEEFEQLDELSKKTLVSYIKSANHDTYMAGKFSKDDKEARAAGRKRKAGVAMAADKLAKG